MRDEELAFYMETPADQYTVGALVHEVKRLRDQNAAMRKLVEVVARSGNISAHGAPGLVRCRECTVVGHEPLEHLDGCPAERARAILAEMGK